MRQAAFWVAFALFLSTVPVINGQTDETAAIQQKLQERIKLAGLDGNGEISTAGTVVTLQKSSLQMAATPNSGAPAAAGTPTNTYKNGKLSAGMFLFNLNLGIVKIDPSAVPMHTAQAGEKFWVVTLTVRKGDVQFRLWSDPDSNNMRYWTWLVIPLDKKHYPTPDEFMSTLAEVLSVEAVQAQGGQQSDATPAATQQNQAQDTQPVPITGQYQAPSGSHLLLLADGTFTKFVGNGQGHGQYVVKADNLILTFPSTGFAQNFKIQGGNLIDVNTQQVWVRTGDTPVAAPAAAPTHYDAVDLPPPPPPPTITTGMTKEQVLSAYGEPQRKAVTGVKEIFFYTELKMKVTFTNGKVSSID